MFAKHLFLFLFISFHWLRSIFFKLTPYRVCLGLFACLATFISQFVVFVVTAVATVRYLFSHFEYM